MPYPMTRLCVGVGRKEFNFHSFTPCRRVLDMAEALQRYSKVSWFDASQRQGDASAGFRVRQFRTGANCNFPHQLAQIELPQANGMRTLDIPVCRISPKVGRQLDWPAVNCLGSIAYVRALMQ